MPRTFSLARPLVCTVVCTLVCLIMLVPLPAVAQRGGAAPPFGGPRASFSFELSDGEPVSFYLEWSRVLDLTEGQKEGLIDIRRNLRNANAPFMQQLDSLREASGVSMEKRGRVDARDEESLRRFRQWSLPVTDSIRVNNDGARREIRALLDSVQLSRADSLNREMRDAQGRRPNERQRPRPGGATQDDFPRSG
ncbi:MAG: hypothetical protein ABI910_06265 [Gemmatimonadota bacterium]